MKLPPNTRIVCNADLPKQSAGWELDAPLVPAPQTLRSTQLKLAHHLLDAYARRACMTFNYPLTRLDQAILGILMEQTPLTWRSTHTLALRVVHDAIHPYGGRCWLAGGALRDYYTHNKQLTDTDTDIWIHTPHLWRRAFRELRRRLGFRLFVNRQGYHDDNTNCLKLASYQLHTRKFWCLDLLTGPPTPQHCLVSFDYTVNCAAFEYNNSDWLPGTYTHNRRKPYDGTLIHHPQFLDHINRRLLVKLPNEQQIGNGRISNMQSKGYSFVEYNGPGLGTTFASQHVEDNVPF